MSATVPSTGIRLLVATIALTALVGMGDCFKQPLSPSELEQYDSVAPSLDEASQEPLEARTGAICVTHGQGTSTLRIRVRLKTPYEDDQRTFVVRLQVTGPTGVDIKEFMTRRASHADGADNIADVEYEITSYGEYTVEITGIADQNGHVPYTTSPRSYRVGPKDTCSQ